MPAPTVVGVSAANVSGIGTITPAFPTSYTAVANDVALTFLECESTDTVTPPTGWTQLATQSITATGTTTKLTVLWRRIVGGDTAPTIADAGDHLIGRMMIVRGCVASGNPWNNQFGTTEQAADTTVSIPGLVTSADDCLIVAVFGTGQDIASTAGATGWANPTLDGIVERMDDWTTSGTGGGFAVATGVSARAGGIAPTTCTLSLTANFKTLIVIALAGNPTGGVRPIMSAARYG
jgi:hypothetical protein